MSASVENQGSPGSSEEATAIRKGLAARRFFRPLPAVAFPYPSEECIPGLTFYRRPVDHPSPPSRFWGGWLLRLVRGTAKKLVAPWLEHQTEFNEAVLAQVRLSNQYLRAVADRLVAVQREVMPAALVSNARISECFFELHRLAEEVRGEKSEIVGFGEGPPEDPPHVAEGLYALTRIGRPPGRVLVLGPGGFHALDLAGLGFQVVLHTASLAVPSHPGMEIVRAGREETLPFPDSSFDFVVAMAREGDVWAEPTSGVWDEVARVLAPDGRAIGSWMGTTHSPESMRSLRSIECGYARRAGHGWAFEERVGTESELTLWVAGKR